MNLAIRPATVEDIPMLKSLGSELQDVEQSLDGFRADSEDVADQYNAILLRDFLAGEWQVFVAEAEGEVIGYMSGTPNDPEDDLANKGRGYYISDGVINKKYRKLGIGKMLLDAVTAYAKEHGFVSLELNVLIKNSTVQEFLRHQGFDDYELVLRKNI